MNKRILGSVAAIIAVLGLIGGGTFAAWNDYSTLSGGAGAGILQLDVSSTGGAGTAEAMHFGDLAPGQDRIQQFYVASSDAESVPNATLYLTLNNLVDTEGDGTGTGLGDGSGCTTNSEKDAETGDCGTDGGEFSQEAVMTVNKAASIGGSCAGVVYTGDASRVYNFASGANTQGVETLAEHVAAGQIVLDADVAPGEGVCLQVRLGMPLLENGVPDGTDNNSYNWGTTLFDSTNASQGDSSTFDVVFDLVQNT